MTDFLFSSFRQKEEFLADCLRKSFNSSLSITEYHGDWGSLAVSESRYNGFSPHEDEQHIFIVIGGPVLYFHSNEFIARNDTSAGTRAVLRHWRNGTADWSEDLSGPFIILSVDKLNKNVECITDMMMFIPVFKHVTNKKVMLGTHINALALASEENHRLDTASLLDFVLHSAVTYPYTAYLNLRQMQPGSIHQFSKDDHSNSTYCQEINYYWKPVENEGFLSIGEAARYLQNGVQGYVQRITLSLHHVAQFISAGEDSRTVAGLLPSQLSRDGFIFLDCLNREGNIAAKVSDLYGINFLPGFRSEKHYLDILPQASDLVGAGFQYIHAHSLTFSEEKKLDTYRAVFGGYISDALLKGDYMRKIRLPSFMPEILLGGEVRTKPIVSEFFSQELLDEVSKRRQSHFRNVSMIRPNSANEWFELWPATMRFGLPNLSANRRLFASYEIFMSKEAVKVSASVPSQWKLNRRLFHSAFKDYLKKSKLVYHSDGRLPYYPWWVNLFVQAPTWIYRQVAKRTGLVKRNEGPWANWEMILKSNAWQDSITRFSSGVSLGEIGDAIRLGAFLKGGLSIPSKINLMQVCYIISELNEK